VAIIAKLRQRWPQLRAKRKSLPVEFPTGTGFLDVEGVPVSVSPRLAATAWDCASPRPFSTDSALRNGTRITDAEFRADVARRGGKFSSPTAATASHPPPSAATVLVLRAQLVLLRELIKGA
jgi:hypothetical protein